MKTALITFANDLIYMCNFFFYHSSKIFPFFQIRTRKHKKQKILTGTYTVNITKKITIIRKISRDKAGPAVADYSS